MAIIIIKSGKLVQKEAMLLYLHNRSTKWLQLFFSKSRALKKSMAFQFSSPSWRHAFEIEKVMKIYLLFAIVILRSIVPLEIGVIQTQL